MWGFECLSLWRPSPHAMQTLLAGTPSGAFNHPHAAATEHAPPLPLGSVTDGWVLDHNRVQVGAGRKHFDKARSMLKSWQHMDLGPAERFVYATSTTRGHQLVGEERFSVEWHQKDNSVWYEIFTISKPATPLACLTFPLVRFHQKNFARQSLRKMMNAVSEGTGVRVF